MVVISLAQATQAKKHRLRVDMIEVFRILHGFHFTNFSLPQDIHSLELREYGRTLKMYYLNKSTREKQLHNVL